MTLVADTLQAIEARAERALDQELRLMVQEVLALRPHADLEDRANADALLLKLGHLECAQLTAARAGSDAPAFMMPTPRVPELGAHTEFS